MISKTLSILVISTGFLAGCSSVIYDGPPHYHGNPNPHANQIGTVDYENDKVPRRFYMPSYHVD